ncbi:MAG TPA: Gfo/Idh/MocA family oxidoreductase [Chryseosolibacter sp.]|nr:Gfo/Idh/MocA family oxidoreductase [Chryseosolibacter sp.]
MQANRRRFLRQSITTAAGLAATIVPGSLPGESFNTNQRPVISREKGNPMNPGASLIRFAAIGLNHGHIYGQVETVIRGGGELVSFYAKEPDLIAAFTKRFPQAKLARSENEILEDKSIHLVVSASIPVDRAPLGIRVMQHGKDFMADKPGIITLEQLDDVRKVQKQTKRIYSILYGERMENKASIQAGHLIKEGAIGKVVQTLGTGPHRMNPKSRPAWFFEKKSYGGIICDIGSHQCEQFLYFTGSKKAEVLCSQVGNVNNSQYQGLEDFGDATLRGDGGSGYFRVDWFTPEGLKTWGDGRLTILGTEGYMELRKNIDIGGREGDNHLFLVNNKETRYIDCAEVNLPYGPALVQDILNRTETAMTQEHCFLATEIALKAEKNAVIINSQRP